MRLLHHGEDGELRFTADLVEADAIPPYAILSHTWGADDEEVTYEDLTKNAGGDKPGYKKIELCGEQARRDGLQYFWVDTCCINKANKAEHSLAIRSMFSFYRDAARCYVYLPDVPASLTTVEGTASPPPWDLEFRQSKWFTRGWTLQELLAPKSVEFFSREWHRLGDKGSLKSQIHEVTTIPYDVLEGAPVSQSSIEERFRWRQGRLTKLKEDAAYCLSGLFDVDMAPVYDEGTEQAFRRLHDKIRNQEESVRQREECLRDLRPTDPRDDKRRIEDTNGGLLEGSYRWVISNSSFQQWLNGTHSQLLWIKGDPGKGKTMLVCGIIDELQRACSGTASVSYFFCQATDSRINRATAVLRGLLYLLVSQQPALTAHVRKRYDQAGKSTFEDVNAWVALTEIFADVLQDPNLHPTYLLIDALDECVTDLPKLLQFLAKQSSATSRVKWIVSSRNLPEIEEQLKQAGHKVRLSLELNAKSVSAAVGVFIQHKISQLAQHKKYDKGTQSAVFKHLMSNANDTFLWVALVCQDLEKTAKRNVLKKLNTFPPRLDALYERMMQQVSASDDAELCRQVLAAVALVYRPLTLAELVSVTELLEDVADEAEVREIIDLCGSFLTLQANTIYFVHQSAQDFLFAKASDEVFPRGIEAFHRVIFSKSLATLSNTLHRDLYDLGALGTPIDDVKLPTPDPLASSRYSCIYWIDHLCASKATSQPQNDKDPQIIRIVDEFVREKYLYWLEGLSLCKSIAKGVVSMSRLCSLIQSMQDCDGLRKLLEDARRFIMYHNGPIENYPLQTYSSALLFSPAKSAIKALFLHEELEGITIKPAMSASWGACLQTLEGHSESVRCVAFSHDSTKLASGSPDESVKLWDVSSGECLQTFNGHTHQVLCVAFSHDSTILASASSDTTIQLWDVSSSEHIRVLEGHSRYVSAVAFSHDSMKLASASGDTTIRLWDVSSGECLQTIAAHSDSVRSIAFSHNSTRLASGSDDTIVKLWNAGSSTCVQTLKGHTDAVWSVAFSHDSTKVASGSNDNTVKLWDTSSGKCLQTFQGCSSPITFSHDSKKLAAVYSNSTIKLWDVSSGRCLQTFTGHADIINSVVFSHDSILLGSASWDKTIKLWDVSSNNDVQPLTGHTSTVGSIVISHDSTLLASASWDMSIKLWDTSSHECLRTFTGHDDAVFCAAFSHKSTRLASGSVDTTIKLWETSSGACLGTFIGHIRTVTSVAFSQDSTRLASGSEDGTVKLWSVSSGDYLRTFEGGYSNITSVAFSYDSTQLAGSNGDTVFLWDAGSGACLQRFTGHNDVDSIVFSEDSTKLASGSSDHTIRLWDVNSGTCLRTFDLGASLRSLSFGSAESCSYKETGGYFLQVAELFSEAATEHRIFKHPGAGVSSDNTWIKFGGDNVLWLPSEYRPSEDGPSCSFTQGTMIAIGIGSGRVWTCNIDL